jgi:hypothetical protein
MLFALVLGVIVGAAAVVLVQQWLRGMMVTPTLDGTTATSRLARDRFPHLAPPARSLR